MRETPQSVRHIISKYSLGVVGVVSLLLCIIIFWILFSDPYTYEFRQPAGNVDRIEIVRKITDTGRTSDPVEVLLVLQEMDHAEILETIQTFPAYKYINDPSTGIGVYQFRIYYKNGEIEIISNENNAYITSDGRCKRDRVHFTDNTLTDYIISLLDQVS